LFLLVKKKKKKKKKEENVKRRVFVGNAFERKRNTARTERAPS